MNDERTAPTPVQPESNRFDSVSEVGVGSVVWAYASGYWRECRVLATARTRVTLAFYLRYGIVKRQTLPLGRLRREQPRTCGPIVSTSAPALFGEAGR